MKKRLMFGLFFVSLMWNVGSLAQSQSVLNQGSDFTQVQQQAIQKIVHDYLVSHPEVLMEAASAFQKKQQAQWQETASKVVPQISEGLFNSAESPVLGNPNGQVTLVEFFDYQCPHCKDMAPQIQDILNHDKDLKVIYKALPIFGDVSVFAAKASMASQKQGKFAQFHAALLKAPTTLNQETVIGIAKQVGINIDVLQKDMQSPLIDSEIKQNDNLAKQLKLTGTPAFVISAVKWNDKTHKMVSLRNTLLIPGAVGENLLVEAIGQVRAAK